MKKHKTPSKVETTDCFLNEDQYTDRFLQGRCEDVMKKLPSESIDLVVTSPPYNLRNSTGNGMKDGRGGKWANAALIKGYEDASFNDNMPHNEYVEWQRDCLTEMMRVLKPNGAIFYNHKWRVQAGLLQDRTDIVSGFPVRQIIIWRRKGGINFNKGYFLPTYEVIYLIAKKDFILAKGANSHGDIWEFGQEQNNSHPAPFPVALITRIISSTNSTLVLDPFMGSGTTALAAKMLKRNFVGIELSKIYIDMAQERLSTFLMEHNEESSVEQKKRKLQQGLFD
jgi:modification methylase